jgi:SAM-dependent methyltransferase
LLIQSAALLLTVLLYQVFPLGYSSAHQLWQPALITGGLAAALSAAFRQRAWWPPLHFAFMPTLWGAQHIDVPAELYLVAFVTLVLVYWSSFRTQVPLFLSGRAAWKAVAGLLPADREFRFIDLGSGLGGLPLHLAATFPRGHFYGTEIAPAPWLISRVRAVLTRSRVRFLRRDYGTLDLGEFDVVFAFLSPAAMPRLWKQAQTQMRPGSLFISLAFAVDRQPAHRVISSPDGPRNALHVWQM